MLAATTSAAAADAEITGTWKTWFIGPIEYRPKMVSEIVLNLKADGTKLTGTVHAGKWPGDAPISDGKIDGNRISFTAVGKIPWRSGTAGAEEPRGYPKLDFVGRIESEDLQLTLTWGSVMISSNGGTDDTKGQVLEMKGRKTADSR
jgi:hypothetical protein